MVINKEVHELAQLTQYSYDNVLKIYSHHKKDIILTKFILHRLAVKAISVETYMCNIMINGIDLLYKEIYCFNQLRNSTPKSIKEYL
jgi:hypothetical protein